MKQVNLQLIPEPGKNPEFLATLQIVDPSPAVLGLWQTLADQPVVVLEGYTREAWAWKPGNTFQTIVVESVDGKQKLPGFIEYLKQRQKSAYARVQNTNILWIISYIQAKQTNRNRIECRLALDINKVPNCSLKPKPVSRTTRKTMPPVSSKAPTNSSSKSGFLGKLVGAQQRTNQHVMAAAPAERPTALSSASQVLAEFRQTLQKKMLDFDIDEQQCLPVKVSLPTLTVRLDDEEKNQVTMEVLKYMVYEAAEEVNEEWIVHRELTGFVDEAEFVVYKEGAAPPEVLEEIQKAELPDEIRGQQRALQETRARQVTQREREQLGRMEEEANRTMFPDDDLAVLNQNKRDRRTIEDYEREKASKHAKR